MQESVFAPGFDMQSYVQKRALEIADIEQRKQYKEVADHMMLALYAQTQEAVHRVESRVLGALAQPQSNFSLTMGLTDQAHYDASDPFLFPVFSEDTITPEIPAKELLDELRSGREYPLYTVYLQAGYPAAQRFSEEIRRYSGVVKTPRGALRATFRVEQDPRCKAMLTELYHSFIKNGVPWRTVCTAYLRKCFRVLICTIECEEQMDEITEIDVDFEECAPLVRYRMIPLWNLELMEEKSSTYPVPCEGTINFEHRILAHRLGDSPYLVGNAPSDVSYVYRANGDLIIVGPVAMPYTWKLYKFNHGPQRAAYPYPLLTNKPKDSFLNDLTNCFHKQMRTQAGIAAMIERFPYDDLLFYQGAVLCERPETEETYDMDDFLVAQFGPDSQQRGLCLQFRAKEPGNIFNNDILSFLVAQVQAAIPDYHCFGALL